MVLQSPQTQANELDHEVIASVDTLEGPEGRGANFPPHRRDLVCYEFLILQN